MKTSLLLILVLSGCGTPTITGIHLNYKGFSETQSAELDCTLGLMPPNLTISGNVFLVDSIQGLEEVSGTIVGQTTGRDDAIIIDLVGIPELPLVFVHELVHVLAGQEIGTRLPKHDNLQYFGPDSISDRTGHQAIAFCKPRGF